MIERLYVHNFRCLENFTLDLSDCSSVLLIGKNGAGKSTVHACLSLLQSICRGGNRSRDLVALSDFAQLRSDHPMRFEVEVLLTNRRFQYAVAFEWPGSSREARVLEESLSTDGTNVFTRENAQIQLAGGNRFGIDSHLVALPLIKLMSGERDIEELRAFLASMVLIAPIPSRMSGFSDEPSLELNGDASNYAACLKALIQQKPAAYRIFEKFVRSVIPDFGSIEHVDRGPTGTQLIITFEAEEPPRSLTVDFDSLSEGEKCYFLGAFLVAWSTTGFPLFCFWDEPDNHLSLSEVGHFITSLRKASKRGNRLIATSHHPEAVRSFSDETTLVLVRRSHLDPTVSRRLADLPYHGDLVNSLSRGEIIG